MSRKPTQTFTKAEIAAYFVVMHAGGSGVSIQTLNASCDSAFAGALNLASIKNAPIERRRDGLFYGTSHMEALHRHMRLQGAREGVAYRYGQLTIDDSPPEPDATSFDDDD